MHKELGEATDRLLLHCAVAKDLISSSFFLEIFSVKCVIVLVFFSWQGVFGKHRISANLEWCPALPYSDRENLTFNSIELLTLK